MPRDIPLEPSTALEFTPSLLRDLPTVGIKTSALTHERTLSFFFQLTILLEL
ncbi:hypothetical protein [Leptospira jelokensis]|uniref:hypothetical protein n=1 Tax=Leptospira jelokensis TaxID=2484931 RepID=UPI0014384C56|nr:hypothetical protein [Leptospira jelokensis]